MWIQSSQIMLDLALSGQYIGAREGKDPNCDDKLLNIPYQHTTTEYLQSRALWFDY